MWLFLKSGFYSVVTVPGKPELLRVRARRAGDIERLFPQADVKRTPGRDYLYRAELPRAQVAAAIAENITAISAPNFKDSVTDPLLHAAYSDVWARMARLQSPPPYSRG